MTHDATTSTGNTIPSASIDEIIEDLRGTCKSLDEACHAHSINYDDLTMADHQKIDGEIFECNRCNWWCTIDEQSEKFEDELVCTDCEDD